MKRRTALTLTAALLLPAAAACSPEQIANWQAWHDQDAPAAEAWLATAEAQSLVVDDWDHDGVVEPDVPHDESVAASQETRTVKQRTTTRQKTTTRSSSSSSSSGSSGVNWDRVAQCESGQQWGHGQVTNRYGTFSGGLMIMNSAWRQFGGTEFAPTAGQASRAQQIVVAERIAARVGAARAWQCPVG